MKSLVVVESPTKARTIGRYLGSEYLIKASMGHIIDLPKSKLGVDIEKDFDPQYELVSDKKKIIAELKSAAKEVENIILATDPDREGEAIAYHVKDVISSSSKFKVQSSKFRRIVFHEITKEAIEEALKTPRDIDENLVDAQTARRVLDRLVGYKLSPLLWQKVRRGLSAGRVQSIALRLIVEREREIEKFKKEEYWTVKVILDNSTGRLPHVSNDAQRALSKSSTLHQSSLSESRQLGQGLSSKEKSLPTFSSFESGQSSSARTTEFELIEINGEKIEVQEKIDLYDGEYTSTKTIIDNQKKADEIVNDLKIKNFIVNDVSKKETRRSPQAPYTTSTLQQEASRRLGFTSKRTMRTAQSLYEEGLITYHRTDSVVLSQGAINAIRNFAQKEFGEKYITPEPRFYKTKQKLAQEAHEGIRPTKIGPVLSIKNQILSAGGNDGWRLYELIWRRAIASQMSDAVIESTTVLVNAFGSGRLPHVSNDARFNRGTKQNLTQNNAEENFSVIQHLDQRGSALENPDYALKTTGSILMFEGFLKINPQALEDRRLPDFIANEKLNYIDSSSEEHETNPPPRYNDASLIKTLEEKGIGRPSTYASIISVIEERRYVERIDNRFAPTSVGIAVNDFLVKNFSDIDDIPFTAEMEDELDEIANGEREWKPMIKEFYTPFSKKLEEVKGAERVKIEVEETDEKCPKCGAPLVIRMGKFGKFLSCSKFPDCDFKKAFIQETGFNCPKDNGKIIARKTRKGRVFYGCSNYPKCKFAVWKLEDLKNPELIKKKLSDEFQKPEKKEEKETS